jgi:hypothetical protein
MELLTQGTNKTDLTEGYLESLIADKVEENLNLDYKSCKALKNILTPLRLRSAKMSPPSLIPQVAGLSMEFKREKGTKNTYQST